MFSIDIRVFYDNYIHKLVSQDVRDSLLDSSWTSILIRLAWKVCQIVKFDLKVTGMRYFDLSAPNQVDPNKPNVDDTKSKANYLFKPQTYSSMDIRYYVHVKKVSLYYIVFIKKILRRVFKKSWLN